MQYIIPFVLLLSTLSFSAEYRKVLKLEQACERKIQGACYELGYLYEKGLRVTQNLSIAKKYYKKSCDYGNDTACKDFENIEMQIQSR